MAKNIFDQFDEPVAQGNVFDQFDESVAQSNVFDQFDEPVVQGATFMDSVGQGFDTSKAAEMLALNEAHRANLPKYESALRDSSNPVSRWWNELNANEARDGLKETQQWLTEHELKQAAAPRSAAFDAFTGTKTFGEAAQKFAENPVEVVKHGFAQSAVPMGLMLGNAYVGNRMGGVTGGALAGGASSFDMEYKSGVIEGLKQSGVDVGNPTALNAALGDKALMNKIHQQAEQKALVIGAADGLSMGIAGKALAATPVKNALAQAGVQVGLGAGGEAGGAVYSGQDVNPSATILEGVLEIPGSVAETAIATRRLPFSRSGRSSDAGAANVFDQFDAPAPTPVGAVTGDGGVSAPAASRSGGGAGGGLGGLISSGEGGYGSFNRGNAGDAGGAQIDFAQMTVGELMRRQALPKGDGNRVFAFGKYQIIPETMRLAVDALGIDPNAPVTPELQERIFSGYLLDGKRPAIAGFIRGEHDNLGGAQLAGAQEWASIADPNTGRSYYAGSGNNGASVSAGEFGGALQAARQVYADAVAAGKSPAEAWSAAVGSAGGGVAAPMRGGQVGLDPMLGEALRDAPVEPVRVFDNPDMADAAEEAAFMAELDDLLGVAPLGVGFGDFAAQQGQAQAQPVGAAGVRADALGGGVGVGVPLSEADLGGDAYALAERAAIQGQQFEGGSQVDVGDEVGGVPFAEGNPFVGRDVPTGLSKGQERAWYAAERGRRMAWDVDNGVHPSVDPSAFTGDVPFKRGIDGAGAATGIDVNWQSLPDQQDAAILSQAVGVRLAGGQPLQFTAVAPPMDVAPVVQVVGKVFGKKVVFVKGEGSARTLFQGAIIPSAAKNRIFVNVDSQAGYVNVIGHELYEHLQRERPDLHAWFAGVVGKQVRNLPRYQRQLAAWEARNKTGVVVTRDDALAELAADFTGDALADAGFLRALAADHPGKFRQFAAAVLRWLDSLVARLRGERDSGSATFFRDVEGMRVNLRAVLAAYAPGEGGDFDVAGVSGGDLDGVADIAFMRFPQSPSEARAQLGEIYQSIGDAVRRGMSERADVPLHLMSFNTLVDRFGGLFRRIPGNPMRGLEDSKRLMQAVQMHWANRFQKSHDAFMRLSVSERTGVTQMMLDATLLNMHPDRDYRSSIDVVWARKRIAKFEDELRGIAADERRQRQNQAMSVDERQLATVRAQAGIKALERKIQQENKRAESYPELQRQWWALNDAQRTVYGDWLGQMSKLWEKQTEALEARIADIARGNDLTPGVANQARETVQSLRVQFRKQLEIGPYFPLKRYGNSIVQIREGADYARYHFESEFEARQFADKLRADKPTAQVLVTGKIKPSEVKPADAVGQAGRLLALLQQSGSVDQQQMEIINQFVMDALPDLSARKAEMRRYFVAGASGDMERGFANSLLHGGHDLARILFGHKIEKGMRDMEAQVALHSDIVAGRLDDLALEAAKKSLLIAEKDLPQAARVLSIMRKQVDAMMNPNTSATAAFMGNLAFIWYLAGSAWAGLINITQTEQVTFPVLAARFGAINAQAALMRAAADVMKAVRVPRSVGGGFDVRQSIFNTSDTAGGAHLTADERELLFALELDGTTETTQAHEVARTASGDGKASMGSWALRWDKVMAFGGFFFHNAEVMNRQVAQLAAFRLLKAANPGVKGNIEREHGSALDFARWVTTRTHFDYSHANRSLFTKSNTAKVLLPMKNYSFLMSEFLLTRVKDALSRETDREVRRLARSELTHVVGMTVLMAGVSGLPMMWLFFALANAFGDDEDEPWEAEAAWDQFLRDNIGETGEALVNRGAVNAAVGLDLSSRIGLASLFYREPGERVEGRGYAQDFLEQLAGVNYSLVAGVFDGAELIQRGEYQKGFEKMVPTAIRNISKSARMATEGVTARNNDVIVAADDLNAWDIANQALGMSPDQVTAVYKQRNQLDAMNYRLQARKTELLNEAKQFYLDGGKGDFEPIRRDLARWNAKNPHEVITQKDVQAAVARQKKAVAKREGLYGLTIPEGRRKQLEDLGYLK